MMDGITDFIGRKVVSPIVECVDVDGVARRIEIDDIVNRVDINALVDRIEIDKLIDRVDLNRQLHRVDMNALLNRVDINALLVRSDMAALFAQSTTGVFSHIFDLMRTHLIVLDLFQIGISRVPCDGSRHVLPPQAYVDSPQDHVPYPKKKYDKAVVVQGRFTGFFSKAFAVLFDVIFLTILYALVIILIQLCWIFFVGESREDAQGRVSRDNRWVIVLYCVHWWLYFFLCALLTGRTIGMAIVGLQVVNAFSVSEDDGLSPWQAFVRTSLLPVSLTLFPPLGIMGVWRRDGRMLHDYVAGTGIIYSWDALMAKNRHLASKRVKQQQRMSLAFEYADDSPRRSRENSYHTFDSNVV